MLLFMLAVVIDDPSPPAAQRSAPPHIYLHPPTDGCDSRVSDDDEVVVCANRSGADKYRLNPADDARYQAKPIRAEAKIGNATLSLKADPTLIGDAQDDVHFKRRYTDMRLRLTIPF